MIFNKNNKREEKIEKGAEKMSKWSKAYAKINFDELFEELNLTKSTNATKAEVLGIPESTFAAIRLYQNDGMSYSTYQKIKYALQNIGKNIEDYSVLVNKTEKIKENDKKEEKTEEKDTKTNEKPNIDTLVDLFITVFDELEEENNKIEDKKELRDDLIIITLSNIVDIINKITDKE